MNFDELRSEVLSIVKRPDQMPRIEAAIRAATLKAHRQDYFFRDLVETGVQFAGDSCIRNFLPSSIFGTRFRKIKYIRYWMYDGTDEQTLGSPSSFLTAIDIENSLDAYGYTKTNVYYMAGELVQIRTSQSLTHCLVGAYLNPIVTETNFSSWIADSNPYAIIYEACRQVFNQIGKASDAQTMTQSLIEEYSQLKLDSINRPGD